MMNFAAHHGYPTLGVTAAGNIGLTTSSFPGTPGSVGATLPQRSPFAIQELLGLGNQDVDRPRHHHHQGDAILSASAYLSPSLSNPLASSPGSGFKDSSAALPYSSWRSTFISALNNSTQGMFGIGPAQSALITKDLKSGKIFMFEICLHAATLCILFCGSISSSNFTHRQYLRRNKINFFGSNFRLNEYNIDQSECINNLEDTKYLYKC